MRSFAGRRDAGLRDRACMRLIAKMPTLAAIAYKTAIGKVQSVVVPQTSVGLLGLQQA